MQQEVQLESCPNCHRMIDSSRLPLHIHMCSTIKMRQSRISFDRKQQESLSQNNNNQEKGKKQSVLSCIFCSKQIAVSKMEAHMSNCQYRHIECEKCKIMFPFSLMWQHKTQCSGKSIPISNLNSQKKQPIQTILPQSTPQIQQNTNNLSELGSTYIQGIRSFLNSLDTKLTSQGTRISTICNTFIEQNKGPVMQKFYQIKDSIWYQLQTVFIRIATDPNVEGLSRTKIEQIRRSEYRLKGNGQQEQVCTICYCDLQDMEPIKVLSCKHIFHPQCIDKWMRINRTCPVCKHDQLRSHR